MTSVDFASYYAATHNRSPFPWQQRLATQVLEQGRWPDRISVPTACGKTSVLDVAVFALAAQADRGPARTAPLRIFFVVDRRLVVDDVTEHAGRIRAALDQPAHDSVRWVREQLEKYGARHTLATATLRGGMYRSNTWADEPNQPLICASTVDQVGSRLLFRGYGVSESRRPVDAGLTGADSLIILDEAHLSNPFLQTLRSVREYQGRSQTCRPVQLVEMSATTRGQVNVGLSFGLGSEDHESLLSRRLSNEKRVVLKEAAPLEKTAVEEALRLQGAGAAVVGIVMNSVASARATFEELPATSGKILLTGRIRPYDRDALLANYLHRMKAGRTALEPLIVVATQTIEAGADLDFDALISELAPLDCLIQRFGRLNRTGRLDRAEGVILRPKRGREGTGIYGDRPESSWQLMSKHAKSERLDFSSSALEALLDSDDAAACMSPSTDAPLLLPAHLDAWVQTNPEPAADPDVAPFLHGPDTSADIQIVWRADLPEDVSSWSTVMTSVPPLSAEALPLPIRAARRWLRRQEPSAVTDIEADPAAETIEKASGIRNFVVWRGPENSIDSSAQNALYRIRAGDTIVVHSSEGGCDEFGWNPNSNQVVADVGDTCNNERARQGRGRFRLRLDPQVFESQKRDDLAKALRAILEKAGDDGEFEADLEDELLNFTSECVPESQGKGSFRRHGKNLVWSMNGRSKASSTGVFPEETDEDDSGQYGVPVPISLERHTAAVAERADRYAALLCTGERDRATIHRAAKLHDLGKRDDRFQMALGAGLEPLAKSETDPSEYRQALRRAGYPKGGRHEFASVLLAQQSLPPPECDRQLALHLIGTHHGHGRPLAPFWVDPEDPDIRAQIDGQDFAVRGAQRLARLDSGWIDQFWSLNRTYGWWGLAFLEAILRRADCIVSREEQGAGK